MATLLSQHYGVWGTEMCSIEIGKWKSIFLLRFDYSLVNSCKEWRKRYLVGPSLF